MKKAAVSSSQSANMFHVKHCCLTVDLMKAWPGYGPLLLLITVELRLEAHGHNQPRRERITRFFKQAHRIFVFDI